MSTDRCPALLRANNGGDKEAHFACRLPPGHATPYHHDGARWWWLDDGEVHMSVGRPDGAGPCRWCDGEGGVWIQAYGRRVPCDGCNGSGSRLEGVTDDTLGTLRGRIVQALIDRDLTEANGGRPNPGMLALLDPYSRQMIEGNARGRADAVMAAVRPELDARDARARKHGARIVQMKSERDQARARLAAVRELHRYWDGDCRECGAPPPLPDPASDRRRPVSSDERRNRYARAMKGRCSLAGMAEEAMKLADAERESVRLTLHEGERVMKQIAAENARLRADLAAGLQVGRCGAAAPSMPGVPPAFCALPAGHAGWHKGREFTDVGSGVRMAAEWSAGEGP